jgi:hypothetical protein
VNLPLRVKSSNIYIFFCALLPFQSGEFSFAGPELRCEFVFMSFFAAVAVKIVEVKSIGIVKVAFWK